jgi:gliding motility-associated-like protein
MSIKTRIKQGLFFCMVAMVCFCSEMSATHIVGGDLRYTCLGNDLYEITLVVRRDCANGADDAQFDDPAIIGIYDIFGSLQPHLGNLGRIEIPFVSEDTITNDILFDCSAIGNPVCVHESTYTATVSLPFNKLGYCLAYQRCCRNVIINNIEDPLETGATFSTCITTDALESCNSQPEFVQWPDVYVCTNMGIDFDHSAIDPDGDELVYRLCTPNQGATIDNPLPSVPSNPPYSPVVWQSPFNLNNLLGGDPLTIDPQTGRLTGVPNTIGTFVVGICVDEFRDGELLSTYMRDFEYTVRVCTDPIVTDFEVLDNDCDGDNTVTFNNLTTGADSFMWFFDFPGTTLTSTEVSPTFTYPANGKYTVRLEASRDSDGCTTSAEKVISTSSTPLDADFTATFESCDNGNLIRLSDISTDPTGISCAQAWTWTVSSTSGTQVFTGNPVLIDVGNAQSIDVTLEVVSSSGCVSDVTRTINLSDIFPNGSFTTKLISCNANGFLIELTNTSTGLTGNNTINWEVNDNGTVTNLTGSPVQIEVSGDNLSVNLMIESDNGCDIDFTRAVDRGEFLPDLVIGNSLGNGCVGVGSTTDVTFNAQLSGGNTMANPVSYDWIIDGINYTTPTVTLPVMEGQLVNLQVTVTYDNGCVFSSGAQTFTPSAQPELTIIEDLDCTGGVNNTVYTLTDATAPPSGASITSQVWTVNGMTTSGPSVSFQVTDASTSVSYTVTYSNGCIATFTNSYTIPDDVDVVPMIDFTVEPIECNDSTGIFVFTDNTMFSSCLAVESIVWVINGITYTGSPVTVILPLGVDVDFSLTVTLTDGTVVSTEGDGIDTNDTINTNDVVDQITIEIENKLAANCTDSLSLCVTNPDPNVNYEWSTDPDFNNIIGMGTTINTLGGDGYTGVVYVRTTENVGDCVYGETIFMVDSDAINLSFDMPFIICPGDTANFEVTNNNIDQVITYDWKGGDGQLIEGADTNNPLIGVPVDAMDDFFFVLCTSNDLGCTSVDTIRFEISTNEPLDPFMTTTDSCGSLTVMFDEAPNMLDGNGYWDFGDGSPLSNELNPTYTYGMEGNYIVTLSDSSAVCPMDDVSVEIFVGELDISVSADTITYGEDETPVVPAETNANNATITWCTLAGDSIFTGNPLEGYDPPMDTMTVIVKVEDALGCTDQDTIVLIRDIDDTEECLESVVITGPDMNLVCVGDTFQLCVTMRDDCNLEDFTYLWEDNGCIVGGQGTPKLTATADSDKTFNVVITSVETGQDSMYSIDVMVSNPMVTITIPPSNIDDEGEPFVCLGETVTLTAEGDPDCEYLWSTGETGQTIEVSPEELTQYTVRCITSLGCESSSQVFVLNVVPPQCDENDVFIPTAFSPNGDNVNDVLLVRSKFIRDMELLIQNRWGEEVFLANDQETGWDGTFKGKQLPPDVYSYCLKVTCINDSEYSKVGNVTLVK